MARKIYRKTYGVRGLLEWHMTLRTGRTRVRLVFDGGAMGCNGVIPAKYVTESTAIQRMIESSEPFLTGKVYLHGRPVETGEEYGPVGLPDGDRPGAGGRDDRHGDECRCGTDNREYEDRRDRETGGAPAWGGSDDYE